MKQTVNFHLFADAFRNYDRADNFSYDGLKELFNWCEDVDPEMELDVIALCCDWTEVSDMEELRREYLHVLEALPEDATFDDCAEELENHTSVIRLPKSPSIIIAAF